MGTEDVKVTAMNMYKYKDKEVQGSTSTSTRKALHITLYSVNSIYTAPEQGVKKTKLRIFQNGRICNKQWRRNAFVFSEIVMVMINW